ncbi:MAG: phosphoribosylformylglycinamidine synthase subunit PurL [Vicinamibacterales bacterium]|jgi:phosphoribosylformylglycinamidine synthase|nr:phosphoribosylformylglycinamidine synthase II [Acidobacteriota bacterium]MDP6371903.1 phosphoribosylformylglycinamidine synthase subunit PurL [Vicinamibacterales bacterium]MDP6609496.1 phosphoribosylformylglycinamidine synthase subunit PurL [Vicinamibacterales bacterium]HAK55680.1 phosphoribosylformylglycinamidine synthase subunit PurL [Acidobacteriota bacterium]|tara:strand:+ start:13299 stop:15551 length:2253 start_codon:yes stop_codon:yes gene_type:complete
MAIDTETLERHGLSPAEYDKILDILGREPSMTELGIFSVMWSEHCSYKSSRIHLKTLPTTGSRVVQGPGENAGAVDVGDGLVAVFKIESHNHPSFIEPYQGAATGVGGIIRDIFTMGARPIALLNSLRFGPLEDVRTRGILEGVVAGIGGYGNSIGIPTVGGEVAFEEGYAGNPLVNVFCLGLAKAGSLVMGQASGAGNPVYYVGAKTGRDGIHGATMASAEFDERSSEKRPAVQVGDPFMEKLLLEACLELMQTDALVGIQDMGAAGLTCSTSEMGSRGGAGIDIDVSRVPQRESGMTPYEIMLSESQERMLMVVKQGREAEVERIFEKWDLHAVPIGEVTTDGLLRVRENGSIVAEIPNGPLADEAPLYDRPTEPPAYLAAASRLDPAALPELPATDAALRTLLGSPAVASKRWIYRQYDHMVRTNTISPAGMGAGVVRLKGTNRALAMSVDGNGRHSYLDPHLGAMLAVAEASRNVACAGALPIAATNCLNFGNPERPDIMWQFARAVAGIGEACRALDVPITGGNVSLYNETDGQAIYPTPVLGVVGVIEDASRVLGRVFPGAESTVLLLGGGGGALGGSEYLKQIGGQVAGSLAPLSLEAERALQLLLVELAGEGLTRSAHDCSDGGLAVALAECCFDSGGIGVELMLPDAPHDAPGDGRTDVSDASVLFGEAPSRVLVSVADDDFGVVRMRAEAAGVPIAAQGRTGGERIRVSLAGRPVLDIAVAEAETAWRQGLERYFEDRAA